MTDRRDRLAEKKEPTMTDIERAAEKLADVLVESQSREEDIRLIIHALTSHARPAADENARLRAGLMRIRTCTDCPTLGMGDMRKGLHCGLEDRDIFDRYDAADYGFEDATERWIEWARNEADAALTPAAAQAERGEGLCYPFSTETCKRPGCTCRYEAREAGKERGE